MRHRLALLLVPVLMLAACGGGGDGETESDVPAAQPTQTAEAAAEMEPTNTATVEMTDEFTFVPVEIVLKAGGKVTWVNSSEMTTHTSTADRKKAADAANVELPPGTKPWNSRFMDPGERFSVTFDEPGTYRYFCIPHEKLGMLGTIRVVG